MEKKNVLVTGALRGIGNAIAKEYAKHGYNVIIWDIFDDCKENVISEIKEFNVDCDFEK